MGGSAFLTSIVPTGKYFIALGAMDGLVAGYGIVLFYIMVMARPSFYVIKVFFKNFTNRMECGN